MSNIVPVSDPVGAPAAGDPINLPIKDGDDFIAEAETMDLSSLKEKIFMVAVSTGDRDKIKLLASTIRGPYDFPEMVEQVGSMWKEHLHHAKVIVLEKDPTKAVRMLGQNTIDYIEAHFGQIITDEFLSGAFDTKDYTCQAGLVEAAVEDDPTRKAIPQQTIEETPEEEL